MVAKSFGRDGCPPVSPRWPPLSWPGVGSTLRFHDDDDAPLTDVARAPNAQDNSKFAGSYAEGSTYVAPSSFYTSGYRDPYVSLAFYVKPVYDLGTRYKLALTGRLYLEE